MVELFGIKLSAEAAIFLVLFLVDEIIPYTPLKGNNIIQVVSGLLAGLRPIRKEGRVVSKLKAKVRSLSEELNKL